VPSKGRLKEQVEAWLADCGLKLSIAGGARGYMAELKGVSGVQVRLLSAGDIAEALDAGEVHLGITGEDLLRERSGVLEDKALLLRALGFGRADLVVAVPKSWIDVDTMADVDDVAARMEARSGRRLRVATKYVRSTRRFFQAKGVGHYQIVESAGATEGAPAAGSAELVVDITTTGATLAANGLKVLDDGVMLKSQANLVASRQADWSPHARETARIIFDHISACARARAFKEVRTRFSACDAALLADAHARFGVVSPFGGPTSSGMVTLHCPPEHLYGLASFLRERGADAVSVGSLDYVFDRANPLFERLERFLQG